MSRVLYTGRFWAAALERAIRVMAWAALSTIGVNVVAIQDINWVVVIGATILAGLMDILASVAASGGKNAGPSFGPEELKPPIINFHKEE